MNFAKITSWFLLKRYFKNDKNILEVSYAIKRRSLFIYYSTCPRTMVAIEMTAVTKVFWENYGYMVNCCTTVLNNALTLFFYIYHFLLRMSLFLHTAHLI